MSVCDACRDPGACCRDFQVSREFSVTDSKELVQESIAEGFDTETGELRFEEYPTFQALSPGAVEPVDDGDGGGRVRWSFDCSALSTDGRCTIYKSRPRLCRDFEPKSGPLCVEFKA